MRILLVEDYEDLRTLMSTTLGRLGHEVVVTENGEVALNILRRDSGFDVVLTDMKMPLMDGLELTRTLRMHPAWRNFSTIRIVMLSSSFEDKSAALSAGVDVFLEKGHTSNSELQAALVPSSA